jgi:RNA binding exosome subunit
MSLNSISESNHVLINKIEISTLSHATENLECVKKALSKITSNKQVELKINMEKLKGHYDDQIFLLKTIINDEESARNIFHSIMKKMSPIGKEEILEELDNRLDKGGNFYLRLDKQKAFEGKIVLNDVDPIRMKFIFKTSKGKKGASIIRSYITKVIEEEGLFEKGVN